MRTSLMAATALIGMALLTATTAQAQTAEPGLTTDSFNTGLATGATLAPGQITVRLRSQLWTTLSYGTDSGQKTATGKNSGVLLGSYFRLYPKFDAKAANGLEYGATAEIRMNSGGVSGTSANTLYLRRYNGYVGTPTLGRLYIGPENNAVGRLAAGTTMEDFDYNGGFNGSNYTENSSATTINFPFLRSSSFYVTNKIVYLSPTYAGFTFGASWEPSQSTGDAQAASASVINPTSSSIAGGAALRHNTVDVGLQYKASFGPVALTSYIGYLTSGVVNDSAATATTARYKGMDVFAAGARVTYGQFAIGGTYNGGAMNANSSGSLLRQGQRNGGSFVLGAQYTAGPVIMGVQYLNENTGGYYNSNPLYTKSQLHDTGIMIGGAWDYAPGATVFATALYAQRHQFGYNFVGAVNNSSVGNSVQARAIQIGNTFRW